MITRKPLASSNLAEVGYDESSFTLEVLFQNGVTYQYFDVPKQAYEDLVSAPSAGVYFHQHIRGQFRFARI